MHFATPKLLVIALFTTTAFALPIDPELFPRASPSPSPTPNPVPGSSTPQQQPLDTQASTQQVTRTQIPLPPWGPIISRQPQRLLSRTPEQSTSGPTERTPIPPPPWQTPPQVRSTWPSATAPGLTTTPQFDDRRLPQYHPSTRLQSTPFVTTEQSPSGPSQRGPWHEQSPSGPSQRAPWHEQSSVPSQERRGPSTGFGVATTSQSTEDRRPVEQRRSKRHKATPHAKPPARPAENPALPGSSTSQEIGQPRREIAPPSFGGLVPPPDPSQQATPIPPISRRVRNKLKRKAKPIPQDPTNPFHANAEFIPVPLPVLGGTGWSPEAQAKSDNLRQTIREEQGKHNRR